LAEGDLATATARSTSASKSATDALSKVTGSGSNDIIIKALSGEAGEKSVTSKLGAKGIAEVKTGGIPTAPLNEKILAFNLEAQPGKAKDVAKTLQTRLVNSKTVDPNVIDEIVSKIDPSISQTVGSTYVRTPGAGTDFLSALTKLDELGEIKNVQAVLENENVIGKYVLSDLETMPITRSLLKRAEQPTVTTPTLEEVGSRKLDFTRGMASLAAMALTMLMMDCDFSPSEALLNPEMLNHFVVYSKKKGGLVIPGQLDEPSIHRTCFANRAFSDEESKEPLKAVDSSCVKLSDTFCPSDKKQDCIAFAKSSKVDNLDGYTLFLGLDQKYTEKDSIKVISSIFSTYTKPVETSKYPVYRRSSQMPTSLADLVLEPNNNGAFTFISG
jgi:hypothetical protein